MDGVVTYVYFMAEYDRRSTRRDKQRRDSRQIASTSHLYGHQSEAVYTGYSYLPLDVQAKRDERIFARFRDDEFDEDEFDENELEDTQTVEFAQATDKQEFTPEDERQINQVFQAGIPTAIVGTYGTTLGTKVIWQSFAKVIVQRFGAVAAQALGLSAADGLLPVGEAIAFGLLAVTAWQIARNWDELWAEAEALLNAAYYPPPNSLPGFPGTQLAPRKTPVKGGGGLRKRWKERKGKKRIIEWDSQHGRVEVYNKRGKHEGEYNHETGKQTKPADKTRTVEP